MHRPHPAKIRKEEHVFILSLILGLYIVQAKLAATYDEKKDKERE
jgi:hypothetical protein